jgi:hypothetical protein
MDQAAKDKMRPPCQAPAQHISDKKGWSIWQGDQKYTYFDQEWIYTVLAEHQVVDLLRHSEWLPEVGASQAGWGVLAKACNKEFPGSPPMGD